MCEPHKRAWLAQRIRFTVDQAVRLANLADELDLAKDAEELTDVAFQLAYLHNQVLDGVRQPSLPPRRHQLRESGGHDQLPF